MKTRKLRRNNNKVDSMETGTAWKVSKQGVFSGPYFPAFGLNTVRYYSVFRPNVGKYVPEKTPYLDTFHAVTAHSNCSFVSLKWFRKVYVHHAFLIKDDKILSSLLIYKYIFTFLYFCTTYKLTSDKKNHLIFKGNFYF